MIRLTKEKITKFYGRPFASASKARFNADKKSVHSDDAYKYEFGYINGACCYAIIQKKSGGFITLEEAFGLRSLNGKGVWTLNLALQDPAAVQEILDERNKDLGYVYSPSEKDHFDDTLISVHQRTRQQLVIYHDIWRPDLAQVRADPL